MGNRSRLPLWGSLGVVYAGPPDNKKSVGNMDKPICRLCGAKHYASEPHQLTDDVNTPAVNRPSVNTEVNRLKRRIVELEARIAELEGRKPKPDRKAYMREYMRRRRAG